MDVSSPFPTQAANAAPADPRLKPTPDYGTLGPGSDIAGVQPGNAPAASRQSALRSAHLIAAVVGMVAALIVGTMSKAHPMWRASAPSHSSESASARDLPQLDRMKPQKQAETLLELAVGHSQGAVEQISSRVDRWNGKVEWNSQIANLTTAALNSNDMRVRESGVEVELAAYGLAKNAASLEYLLKNVDSPDHSQKIWALWALGLMANRGVESERIVDVLTNHLKDEDPDSRRWAVEGLAVAGSDQAIASLLIDHAQRSVTAGSGERRVQSGGVRYVHIGTAHDRSSAIAELHGRSFARCADAGLGVPGAGGHHSSAITKRFSRMAPLVRVGKTPVVETLLATSLPAAP